MECFFKKGVLIIKPIKFNISNIKKIIVNSGIKNTLLDLSELESIDNDDINKLKIKGVNLQIYGIKENEIITLNNFNL